MRIILVPNDLGMGRTIRIRMLMRGDLSSRITWGSIRYTIGLVNVGMRARFAGTWNRAVEAARAAKWGRKRRRRLPKIKRNEDAHPYHPILRVKACIRANALAAVSVCLVSRSQGNEIWLTCMTSI